MREGAYSLPSPKRISLPMIAAGGQHVPLGVLCSGAFHVLDRLFPAGYNLCRLMMAFDGLESPSGRAEQGRIRL